LDSISEEGPNRLSNGFGIIQMKMMSSKEEDILQVWNIFATCTHSLLPVGVFLKVEVSMNKQGWTFNLFKKLDDLFL
jgi:hypothetical protein